MGASQSRSARSSAPPKSGRAAADGFIAPVAGEPADPSVLPAHGGALVRGAEDIMCAKSHGTTEAPVQASLRWGCDRGTADKICCFNRHFAEHSGYFVQKMAFMRAMEGHSEARPAVFYDSVSGTPLFVAPVGRSVDAFLEESRSHGWPSFRDEEVCWDGVRVLSNGEAVSVDGTHLGHNLPDRHGNRYCINLVSVAGVPL